MKLSRIIVTLAVVMLTQWTLHAQITSVKLAGNWIATCKIEQTSDSSVSFCGICPTKLDKENSSISVASFNLNFGDKELKIVYDGSTSVIPFRFEEKDMLLTFELKGDVYQFTVTQITQIETLILKSKEGNLIYLERSKKTTQR